MPAEQPLSEHARRAARTYGAAADHYSLASLNFWDRFGAATVSRLALTAGHTVAFWESVRDIEPSLFKAFNPWDEITTEAALADLLSRGGVRHPTVMAAPGSHHLDHPDGFWDIVLGSGYRATIDALSQEQHDLIRRRVLSGLQSDGITSLRTDVVFGTARRPK